MKAIRSAAFLAAVVGAALFSGPGQAAASCGGSAAGLPETVAAAPLVFVGTVTGTSNQDRVATVHVDEVWTAHHIPPEVILRGSPDINAAATSVDRHYKTGVRYLFVPASASGPPYDDNSCTMTREFAGDAAALRPPSVTTYPAAPAGPPLPLLAALASAIALAVAYAISQVRARRA